MASQCERVGGACGACVSRASHVVVAARLRHVFVVHAQQGQEHESLEQGEPRADPAQDEGPVVPQADVGRVLQAGGLIQVAHRYEADPAGYCRHR